MQEMGMTTSDWESWLAKWNSELLKQFDLKQHKAIIEKEIAPEVVALGWLGYPGATEEQIADLEIRLGKTLPPSYRAFLKASNGFRQPGEFVSRLLSVKEVEWFRVRNREIIDMWKSDDSEDLSDTLAVSTFGDSIYLLNSKVVTADGEWEAIYFNPGGAACYHYPSFWALMQEEYKSFMLWMEDLTGQLQPEDDPQMVVVKYPSLIKEMESKMQSFSLNNNQDPKSQGWSNGVLDGLRAAKKRIIEIRERSSEPEVIRQQLRSLAQEFEKKWEDGKQDRKETDIRQDSRREGLEYGYLMAKGSIEWFLNELSSVQPNRSGVQ